MHSLRRMLPWTPSRTHVASIVLVCILSFRSRSPFSFPVGKAPLGTRGCFRALFVLYVFITMCCFQRAQHELCLFVNYHVFLKCQYKSPRTCVRGLGFAVLATR